MNRINYQEIISFEAEREDLDKMIKDCDNEIARLKIKRDAPLKGKATDGKRRTKAVWADDRALFMIND